MHKSGIISVVTFFFAIASSLNASAQKEAPIPVTAFSPDHLSGIFGNNPELLTRVQAIVSTSMKQIPSLNLGEVSAMLTTYRLDPKGELEDVLVAIFGGFPRDKKKPQIIENGHLHQTLGDGLWRYANQMVGFLGRDMVLMGDPGVAKFHQQLLERFYQKAEISSDPKLLERPFYFTMVLPDPRRIVPKDLRAHIQVAILKGLLNRQGGHFEAMILCGSSKSAAYTFAQLSYIKIEIIRVLRMQQQSSKDKTQPALTWWATEILKQIDHAELTQQGNIIRFKASYDRVMLNLILQGLQPLALEIGRQRLTLNERRPVTTGLKDLQSKHKRFILKPNWPIPEPKKKPGN